MRDTALRTNVTNLIPEKPSFSFKDGLESVSLEFDSRYLFEHRKSRFTSKSSVWLLHDLSPFLTPLCTVSEDLKLHLSLTLILGLSTIVVLFSALHPIMPLLAPVLGLASLFFSVLFALGYKKKFWICINDDDGLRNTRIKLGLNEVESANRQLFETKLSEAIEAAKQQEYYNFD